MPIFEVGDYIWYRYAGVGYRIGKISELKINSFGELKAMFDLKICDKLPQTVHDFENIKVSGTGGGIKVSNLSLLKLKE